MTKLKNNGNISLLACLESNEITINYCTNVVPLSVRNKAFWLPDSVTFFHTMAHIEEQRMTSFCVHCLSSASGRLLIKSVCRQKKQACKQSILSRMQALYLFRKFISNSLTPTYCLISERICSRVSQDHGMNQLKLVSFVKEDLKKQMNI